MNEGIIEEVNHSHVTLLAYAKSGAGATLVLLLLLALKVGEKDEAKAGVISQISN